MVDRVRKAIRSLGLILCALFLVIPALAQDHNTVPLRDPAYHTIKLLQRRGHLLELKPTSLPYSRSAIQQALAAIDKEHLDTASSGWVDQLLRRFPPQHRQADTIPTLGVAGMGEATTINTGRLDLLRPSSNDWAVYPSVTARATFAYGPLSASAGGRYDRYYREDPDSNVDALTSKLRLEETYLGLTTSHVSVRLGNLQRHWGVLDEPALVLSTNPRSFNHLHLQVTSKLFSVQGFLGALPYMDLPEPYPSGVYRFIAGHRFDWHPTPNFSFTILESLLFTGEDAGPSLRYANPLQVFIFSTDNRPKNAEQNALIAAILWFQWRNLTVYGQAMIDDIQIGWTNDPLSASLAGSATIGGLLPSLDAGFSLLMSTARTYKAEQPEGSYHYQGRGIALPFSDFVRSQLFADIYPSSDITVSPSFTLLVQGEQGSLVGPFPDDDLPMILTGEERFTARLACAIRYQPSPLWVFRADLGLNRSADNAMLSTNSDTRFTGRLSLLINPVYIFQPK